MSLESIPDFLSIFFTVTTVVVFLFPIVKLTPSWLERSIARKVIAHREALAGLDAAIAVTRDAEQIARLNVQRDYHCAALNTLVPGDTQAQPVEDRAAA
jgi:hypothetical protein